MPKKARKSIARRYKNASRETIAPSLSLGDANVVVEETDVSMEISFQETSTAEKEVCNKVFI